MLCLELPNTMNRNGSFFFESRQTHNSEYNIELGDGGDMTSMVLYFIGWLFFLKNPVWTPGLSARLPFRLLQVEVEVLFF